MQNENTPAEGTNSAQLEAESALRGAACSAWVEVSQEVFDRYVKEYPNRLEQDIARICEPPMLTYNDFSKGKVWPQSVVAKVKLYDGSEYHGGRSPVYYLPNDQGHAAARSGPKTN